MATVTPPVSAKYIAVGRRKTSIARVIICNGSGSIKVNGMDADTYFGRPTAGMIIRQPLQITNSLDKVDILAKCLGGGKNGQAGALRLGISRALIKLDPENRPSLAKSGMLTRDPRMVERKKYGRSGARKRFQFSKR